MIGFVFTPLIARTVRSAVLQERELDYVAAARLRGERSPYIMFVEILPNVLQPILVEFTVRLGYAIFAVATLSFLGFGIQPPSPDWGGDISVNYGVITAGFWWETLFPALAIASLVVAVNLVADADLGRVRGMTAAAPETAPERTHALDVANVDVAYRVRGTRSVGAARRLVPDPAGASRTAWSASPARASRRWRSR